MLVTPIFVLRNPSTLQDVLQPSRCKLSHKRALIWELFAEIDQKNSQFHSFFNLFLEIGDPKKGRDPYFENCWNKVKIPNYE